MVVPLKKRGFNLMNNELHANAIAEWIEWNLSSTGGLKKKSCQISLDQPCTGLLSVLLMFAGFKAL